MPRHPVDDGVRGPARQRPEEEQREVVREHGIPRDEEQRPSDQGRREQRLREGEGIPERIEGGSVVQEQWVGDEIAEHGGHHEAVEPRVVIVGQEVSGVRNEGPRVDTDQRGEEHQDEEMPPERERVRRCRAAHRLTIPASGRRYRTANVRGPSSNSTSSRPNPASGSPTRTSTGRRPSASMADPAGAPFTPMKAWDSRKWPRRSPRIPSVPSALTASASSCPEASSLTAPRTMVPAGSARTHVASSPFAAGSANVSKKVRSLTVPEGSTATRL